MHILDIGKGLHILKNHMLLQATAKIDNIGFTCMLIEHDKWQDVAADFPEYSMDQRIIYLWRCPADISYVGSGNIDDCDVEVECYWTQLRGALIENYMHCYRIIISIE
jgi:hypothetical protein